MLCSSVVTLHHLALMYIILMFVLQLSWDIHLHVHFFPISSLFSVCKQHSFSSLSPFFQSSYLFESKVSSLRQARTQKAFYLFIISLFHFLLSYILLHTANYYTHMHTWHVKFQTWHIIVFDKVI